jgi:protein gp37
MPSEIEWTDEVWNVAVGCSPVSEGCRNCWAARLAARWRNNTAYAGTVREMHAGAVPRFNGTINVLENQMDKPRATAAPVRFFVGSTTDIFHTNFPSATMVRVFKTMMEETRHTYMLLTKRPKNGAKRVRNFLDAHTSEDTLPPHIWAGVSAEDEATLLDRTQHAVDIPAAVRWLSLEPLLGPVATRLRSFFTLPAARRPYQWVVIGGESGTNARPMAPNWAADAVKVCVDHGVPVFFKQWGEWYPGYVPGKRHAMVQRDGMYHMPGDEDENGQEIAAALLRGTGYVMARLGKHGPHKDVLNGRQYHQFPQPHPNPERAREEARWAAMMDTPATTAEPNAALRLALEVL